MPLTTLSEALFSADPTRRSSYRSLLAWLVCTLLLMTGQLDADNYMYITMTFIGSETLGKFAMAKAGMSTSSETTSTSTSVSTSAPAEAETSEERPTTP